MTAQNISKLEAADLLLDSAIKRLLDDRDYTAAIVLAGAAEDLLQGQLRRGGRPEVAARVQINAEMQRLLKHIAPGESLPDSDGHKMQRAIYNWLRHNDNDDDPQTLCVDLSDEALMVVERALENRRLLDGTVHPRTNEVMLLARSRS